MTDCEIVFEKPNKANGNLYICRKCQMYSGVDYVTEADDGGSMYKHMTKHWERGYSLPAGVLTQLTEKGP